MTVSVPAAIGAAAPGGASAGRVCSPSPEDLREDLGQRPSGGDHRPDSLHAGRPEDRLGKGHVTVNSRVSAATQHSSFLSYQPSAAP